MREALPFYLWEGLFLAFEDVSKNKNNNAPLGEHIICDVKLLYEGVDYSNLAPNTAFYIKEGSRSVGHQIVGNSNHFSGFCPGGIGQRFETAVGVAVNYVGFLHCADKILGIFCNLLLVAEALRLIVFYQSHLLIAKIAAQESGYFLAADASVG
jgi:hypothetical protein